MNPILRLEKESLKRICFVGEQEQGYFIFTPTLGLGSTDVQTSHFQYRLAHQLWVLPDLCEAMLLVLGLRQCIFDSQFPAWLLSL